jgi:hypothetical protein
MATYNESNKKNWLIQINDLNDHQIKNVKEYIGTGAGVNPDLGIHHATIAMYLGYKNKAKGIEEPNITKNLKVILFSIHIFFHILNILSSNLFLFLYFPI